MKNDITRDTFDAARQYSRVLLQQGRVQLDADWNEQVSILLHYLQALAADIIGPHGGPRDVVDAANNVLHRRYGFEIIVNATRIDQLSELDQPTKNDLKDKLKQAKPPILIGAGRYYVDGVLCENPRPLPYSAQPGLARAADDQAPGLPQGRYLVYLDVWERLITHLDDDHIREGALNGADTATRSQITAQVNIWPEALDAGLTRDMLRDQWDSWKEKFRPAKRKRGQLQARVRRADNERTRQADNDSTDPCVTSPDVGYRGTENQLYRIEIHRGGDPNDTKNPPTFKWSRDNGSVVARWLEQQDYKEPQDNKEQQDNKGQQDNKEPQSYKLKISDMHDQAHGFANAPWVELSYDQLELQGKPGTLVKVSTVQNNTLTISAIPQDVPKLSDIALQHPKVRRWDQQETRDQKLQDGAVPIVEGQWIDLEKGIQVWFEKPAEGKEPNQYRSGDYWLIPARATNSDVEWPFDLDNQDRKVRGSDREWARQGLPPRGIEHHYAPLMIIIVAANGTITTAPNGDCRYQFAPSGVFI